MTTRREFLTYLGLSAVTVSLPTPLPAAVVEPITQSVKQRAWVIYGTGRQSIRRYDTSHWSDPNRPVHAPLYPMTFLHMAERAWLITASYNTPERTFIEHELIKSRYPGILAHRTAGNKPRVHRDPKEGVVQWYKFEYADGVVLYHGHDCTIVTHSGDGHPILPFPTRTFEITELPEWQKDVEMMRR